MRIGIDATAIPIPRAGAGNYIFNLVRSLAQVDAENRYVVFAKPEHIAEWGIDQANVRFVPSASRMWPLRLAWEQVALPALARRHRLDVLHSPHYTMPLLAPCRSVVTFCDMIFFLYPEVHSWSKRIFFQQMMQLSARRAEALVTISQSTANDLLKLFPVMPDRVHPIPLAVDESFRPIGHRSEIEQVCHKYGLKPGDYILYVGVLEPRKNIPVLLQAYRDLVDRGIHAPLVIVGKKGWLYESIFTTVQILKLENRVVFTGYVPDEDLPFLYNGARLFVYPSLYEGFGLPVLEAMRCGTPVVTTNVSSMPEVAGSAAILVEPNNVTDLSTALYRVLQDDGLAQDLSHQGLVQSANFTWQRCALETLQVYKSLR